MPTATVKKGTHIASEKKQKQSKVATSKVASALFSDEEKKVTGPEKTDVKGTKSAKKPSIQDIKKEGKKESKSEISVTQDEKVTSENSSTGKKGEEASATTKDSEEIVTEKSVSEKSDDSKESVKEKKSFLGSLFGSKKSKEESEEKSKNSREKETITISEPVKATPAPQRKIADQKTLSTFGLTKERDQFIENLSMLVLSGMSIIGAIASIIKQTKSPGMKLILERMLEEIEAGSPVWKAFDRTKFFKGYTISLIRLGEESGNFAENLKVVALEEEKDRDFKSKVRSALMYPIFVLGLTGIVGIGISWFILPKLAKIFYDLKLALPLITKVLLSFGIFLSKHGLVAVPAGVAVIGGIGFVVFGYSRTKFIGEAIIFSIPGIKSLLMEVEVARFGYLLGTLLEAGLPVTKAIDSLANASEVIRYKKFYVALRESIDMGNSFEKSFAAYKNINALIPPPVQQLIISGEQSGNLNKTLIKVGQVLEAKSDTTTKNLTIIMEPILLVIVWAGVVSVAFAVILPIYSLVGGLNNI